MNVPPSNIRLSTLLSGLICSTNAARSVRRVVSNYMSRLVTQPGIAVKQGQTVSRSKVMDKLGKCQKNRPIDDQTT